MKNNLLKYIAAAALVCSFSSQATIIGVFGNQTTAASTVATNLGYDVEVISDYNNLSMYDVVWGLNSSNSSHNSNLTANTTQFDNYVQAGGVFLYHDRYVTDADLFVPGADNFDFFRSFVNGSNIDLVGPNDVAGVDISNSTLDGGSSSNHGYVSAASIDMPFMGIFNNSITDQLVDFTFEYGAGHVYYSSIPLDHYLGGVSPAAFASTYAPNVLAFNVGLAEASDIPEPVSIALFGLALSALGFSRKKV